MQFAAVWIWMTVGAAPDVAATEFFEKKIRPVLVEHCYACHSEQAKKARGSLKVDSRDALLHGGDSGPALVPGKPGESLLVKALRYRDPDLQMPPKGKLSDAVIADLEKWITRGAVFPGKAKATSKTAAVGSGNDLWSFRPVRALTSPKVKDAAWPAGDIDRFLLAKLERDGLKPGPDADRLTLVRRIYFDLHGLPPTPEEIDEFLADQGPDAFARLVDRLLVSPRFGERWGRHWLDLARYADSSGGGRSLLFRDAWRYRDYVIRSFNSDKPFNVFIVEQIAGDLLKAKTPEERRDLLIATGFLLLGPTNYEKQDKPVLEMEIIDEQLDTIGKAFLGMTIGCARCHDHKFDPIPTRDYYALAGILKSTRVVVHSNVSRWAEVGLPMTMTEKGVVDQYAQAVARLQDEIRRLKKTEPRGSKTLAQREAELKKLQAQGSGQPLAMAVSEADKIVDCHISIRGNYHNPGLSVPRGILQAISPRFVTIAPNKSGRLQLAEWLASPENPLTARVAVNRVWHHLFGIGIVRTVDNFGSTGEMPSHPELLDFLAARFVDNGWSIKNLIREIVLSRAYRLSSTAGPEAAKVDPGNRLLARQNRRRLEAEALRDAILHAAGALDLGGGGPALAATTKLEREHKFSESKRSVYMAVLRNTPLEMFEVFDMADPNVSVGARNVSTVSTQALFLLNSPFIMKQAELAARKLLAETASLGDSERLERVYRLALGRLPSAVEKQLVLSFLQEAPAAGQAEAWERIFHTLFACIDFRYVR